MVIFRKSRNGPFTLVSSIFADIQVTSKGISSFAAASALSKISSCLAVVKVSPSIFRFGYKFHDDANCYQMAMCMYGKGRHHIL